MSRLPVVILGDTHFPFHCRKSLAAAIQIIKKERPKIVIQIGDLLDMYAFSRFPKSLNIMTPQQEIAAGRRASEEMWAAIRSAVPKAECFQLMGNHDMRLAKRIAEAMPEVEGMIARSFWTFPGVQTMETQRDELIIDNVIYMHGYRRHGDHVRYNLQSTVVGHTHVGGVVYLPIRGRTLFELNCGYLGNARAEAMSYTQQARISRWTKGLGIIDGYGPRFLPF